jgi:quercetin dioxygenase-like cupin family protein
VKAGETIENPFSGERITFLEVPGEANGDLLRFDWRFPPGFAIPEHVHVRQEERHEILSGTLRGRISGQERDYERGDMVTGPAGITHAWRNPSDTEELRIISELQPALGFGELLETAFSILGDLEADKLGAPKHLLRICMLLDGYEDEFYLRPLPLWRACLGLVWAFARVGALLGYEALSPKPGGRTLPLVSALWLLGSTAGAAMAIREGLPARFAGMTRWRDPSPGFFRGAGTALSPGLPMVALQAAFALASARGGRMGKVGAAGTVAVGVGATIGVLGEPITYKVLSPTAFDPAKAAVVSTAVVLSPLMVVLGARRLFGVRRGP